MSSYFAFPASDALSTSSLTLMENFEKGVRDPQGKLFVQVAQLFTDEIVDALLLNIVRSADANDTGAKVLQQFAGVIKSTVHGLIKQVLGKMSNDELRPLAAYMREHRLTLNEGGREVDYISFPIPDDFRARFSAVLEKGTQGEKVNAELLPCMERFSEMAHQSFYEDSMKSIKLGFIGRKVADVGGAAIRKGSQSAIRHLVPSLEGEQLQQFCEYFRTMLVTKD